VQQDSIDNISTAAHYAAHILLARATRALPRRCVFVRGLEEALLGRLERIYDPALIRDASKSLLNLLLWIFMLSPELDGGDGAAYGPSRVYAIWVLDRLGVTTIDGLLRHLYRIAWVEGFREDELRKLLPDFEHQSNHH
jgi:hypothetical protein